MSLAPVDASDVPVFTPLTARQDTDSWVAVVGDVVRLAQQIAATDFVPKGLRNNVPATSAAMLYGREVGLPPMTALTSIHVVDGRPGMSAEAMRSLVFAAGHEIAFDEATGAVCRMRARRRGSQAWTELAWTVDMARAAGLLGRENWRKYPRAMLIARCTTDLCRMVFPDVIHGFRSTEEIVDMGDALDVEAAPTAPPRSSGTTVRRRPRGPRPVEDTELPPDPSRDRTREEAETPTTRTDPVAASPSGDGAEGPPSPDPAPVEEIPVEDPVEEEAEEEPGERRANRSTVRMILRQFRRLDFTDSDADREERLAITSGIVGREVSSTNDLTVTEAGKVLTAAASVRTADELRAVLAAADEDPGAWDALALSYDPDVDAEVEHEGES